MNVKMPTIVCILTFTSRINFVLSWVEHEKSFITSGQVCVFWYQVYQARLWECMLNRPASLAMSTSVLKALPYKLDIKRHSPSILYISTYNIQPIFKLFKTLYPLLEAGKISFFFNHQLVCFSKSTFSENSFRNSIRVWIKIMPTFCRASVIWIQNVCKGYQFNKR